MEIVIPFLFSPIMIVAIGLIALIGFIVSPYEIHFEDKDESEI